jgi:hypothetical protein
MTVNRDLSTRDLLSQSDQNESIPGKAQRGARGRVSAANGGRFAAHHDAKNVRPREPRVASIQLHHTPLRSGPIAERHGPADPEPFALRGCDLVTHGLAIVAKSACES